MAIVSIDLGNVTQTARVVDAMCSVHGYAGDGSASSRNAFAKAQLIRILKDTVRAHEATMAAEAARAAKVTEIDANVNPT